MSAEDRVQLAMVGCGGIAGAHRKAYQTLWEKGLREFEIVATCDVEPARAEKMADEIAAFQGRRPAVYGRVEDLLTREPGVEATDICAVHRAHHELACTCLDAGKHVTIEKPLAITLRAGRRIMDAADRAGRLLMVAENYRRSPTERAIRWAISTGRIGKLRQLYWVDIGERLWYWGWRDEKDLAGAGWTLDGGVHFADLFRYHVGEVDTVYAVSRAYNPTRYRKPETREDPVTATVEDTTMAVLTFANGVVGTWTSTGAAPGKGGQNRVVYGDLGSLSWRDGLQTREETVAMPDLVAQFRAQLSDAERERLFPAGIEDTMATELIEFVRAVRGRGQVEITGLEGYRDQAISMAVYESAATGAPVRLAQVEDLAVEAYQGELIRGLGL